MAGENGILGTRPIVKFAGGGRSAGFIAIRPSATFATYSSGCSGARKRKLLSSLHPGLLMFSKAMLFFVDPFSPRWRCVKNNARAEHQLGSR